MEIRAFTFRDLCRKANADLSGNWGRTILAVFAVLLIQGIAGYFSQAYKESGSGIISILLIPLNFGIMLYFLRLARHEAPPVESLFEPFRNYFHYLWGGLRMILFIFLWSLLFVVPGIIAAFRYALTYYVMLDHPELSAKESMERSCELMCGYKLKLLGCGMLLGLAGVGALLGCLLFLMLVPSPVAAFLLLFAVMVLWYVPWCGAVAAEFYCHVTGETSAGDAPCTI